MNIDGLKPKTSVEKIELTVVEKEEPRGFISRYGEKGKVCNAVAKDDVGAKIGLTLWNEDIENIDVNDRIRIINGWVKEWDGQLEISAGKFGKMEVLK
jgi:replication factor A1